MKNPLPRLWRRAARLARDAGWTQAADAIEQSLGARPAAPDAAPQPARFIAGSHGGPEGTRAYKLYLPSGDPARLRPLVVMLHGCNQDPDDFALGTGMNPLAEAQGCCVLYPAQSRAANFTRCWNWFKPRHQGREGGECALIAGMTRAVMAQHPIDPRQVHVAGLSAGGAMAALLAQAWPQLYAALGVHSGVPAGAARSLSTALAVMKSGAVPAGRWQGPPPTIVFHGDQDATVHPLNGEQLMAPWAALLPAQREAVPGAEGRRGATRTTYRDAQGRVQAELWQVHGSGHAWSGGHAPGSYTDPAGPDASAQMLRFFLDHPLPAPP